MTIGTVTYSGIEIAKGAVYTQTRGITPDIADVRLIPQQHPIDPIGDLLLGFGNDFIVIKDCLADKSLVTITQKGFLGTITFQDRRWRWSRYPLFSAHFNELDANGDIVEASRLSLQGIFAAVFSHLQENPDVSRVDPNFYPELDQICVEADQFILELCKRYGYDICLGFGDEEVQVWPLGVGEDLPGSPGGELMAASEALNPPTPPQYVDVCFGISTAQARLKLLAVGKDIDGSIKPINSLSYKPTGGWEFEPPGFPNVSDAGQFLAQSTVYKWYLIDTFADGTLDFPDGTGTLANITQLLPLMDALLEVQNVSNLKQQHPECVLYGKYLERTQHGVRFETEITSPVLRSFTLDKNLGLVMIWDGAYLNQNKQFQPAELYLECAFRIRDAFHRQFISYVRTTEVDPQGQGWHTYSEPGLFARTVIKYGDPDTHDVTGAFTNQTILDAYSDQLVQATAGKYRYKAKRVAIYNRPMSGIRLDGLTSQLTHVISDGTDRQPGHISRASQNMDVDLLIRSDPERKQSEFVEARRRSWLANESISLRRVKGND
jgi:hypothetical protein